MILADLNKYETSPLIVHTRLFRVHKQASLEFSDFKLVIKKISNVERFHCGKGLSKACFQNLEVPAELEKLTCFFVLSF